MTIRRGLLTGCALALVLTACAGTTDEPTDPDAVAAEETTEDEGTGAAADDEPVDEEMADHDDEEMADHDDEEMADHDDEEMADHDEMGDDAAATAEDVDRVVEIDMEDIRFSVEELEFTVGERVKFVFENVGAAPHEALIGDMHVQDEHEEEMAAGGGHHDDEGHHEDLSMISLESGESGSFVHEFTEAGELWMGCHVPGHWAAGMRTRITVTD